MLSMKDTSGEEPNYPPMDRLYYGPSYSDEEIEKVLKRCKLNYVKSEDISRDVARLISEKGIVGGFRGGMEVGARALGGRPKLANPLNPAARDQVSNHVKTRKAWRPFGHSLK